MGEAKRKELSKEEAFKEDPDRFIDKDELIIAAVETEKDGVKGFGFYINQKSPELLLCSMVFKLQMQVQGYINEMKMIKAMQNQKDKKIITPDGGNGGVNRIEGA